MNTIQMSQQPHQPVHCLFMFQFFVNGISFCQEGSKLSQCIFIVLYKQAFSFLNGL